MRTTFPRWIAIRGTAPRLLDGNRRRVPSQFSVFIPEGSLLRVFLLLLSGLLLFAGSPEVRGQTYETVFVESSGREPKAKLVKGDDGAFYGTTYRGGSHGYGSVFKITPAGKLTTLVSFTGANGRSPYAGLVKGQDGAFYGTTSTGGKGESGTVFKVTPQGELMTLASLTGGRDPRSGLIQGSDGAFYGTTYQGGANSAGTVFKVTPEGELMTLASFDGNNGRYPLGDLVEGSDGAFYGTTYQGGANFAGTVFKVTREGTLTTLAVFNGANGRYPYSNLVEGSDGAFYGTTSSGGVNDCGTIFKVTPSGVFTTLVSFNGINGDNPRAGLIKGRDGFLYGTTWSGRTSTSTGGTAFKVNTAGELTTLASFSYNTLRNPESALLEGSDGAFYGTTSGGEESGFGTVFKVTPAGELTILASFDTTNGSMPYGGVVEGSDGVFYGTTDYGSAGNMSGSVFKVTSAGEFTTFLSLSRANGHSPSGKLVKGSNGIFYGTTYGGGASDNGTVFKVTSDGALSTLVSFNANNGRYPDAGLVEGKDGAFYGTTYGGGASDNGTVFKVTADGALTTLASFNGSNGSNPRAGVVEGNDGAFYGTTYEGGAHGYGTVFKLSSDGTLTTLVSFNGSNGSKPQAGLVEGKDGAFYGTTYNGGTHGYGTVFKVTADGALTTLVSFIGSNGQNPDAGLVEGNGGAFYGTTYHGGARGSGTVFKVTSSGVLTTLHSFDGIAAKNPRGTPIVGSDGNLYGTADRLVIWRLILTPVVNTNAAHEISVTGATLRASVDPNGVNTSVWFEYGITTAYGSTTAVQNLGAAHNMYEVVSRVLTFLPHTTYHFRAVALNANGIKYGEDGVFKTLNTAPVGSNPLRVNFGATPSVEFDLASLFTDADGDEITISLNKLNHSGAYVSRLGATTFRFTADELPLTYGGTVRATFSATDAFGGIGYGEVYISDVTPPSITRTGTLPTVSAGANGKAALPDIRKLFTGADNVGVFSVEQLPAPGTVVGVGPVSIEVTVRDGAGLSASETVALSVIDTTAPSITQIRALPVLSTGVNGTVALPDIREQFRAADNVGVVGFEQSPSPGSNVGPGAVTITLTARDGANLTATKTVMLQVADATPPSITQSGTLPMVSLGGNGKAVLPDIRELFTAADNVGVSSFEQSPAPGTVVGLGEVRVTLTARDGANLSVTKTVVLNVVDTTPPSIAQNGTLPTVSVGANGKAALPDIRALFTAADNVGVSSFEQSPAPETEVGVGRVSVTLTARDDANLSESKTVEVEVVDTILPTITAPAGGFTPGKFREGAPLPSYTAQAVAADNVSVAEVTQNPAAGTPTSPGSLLVTLTVHDSSGNTAETSFTVTVTDADPVESELASTGTEVPGAGEEGSGVPAGAVWKSFGVPAINDAGQVAFLGTWKSPEGAASAIFVDERLVVKTGDFVPGLGSATFKSFKDPVLNGAGGVAFLATISGSGVKKNSDTVLVTNAFSGALEVIAREGDEAPETESAKLRSFYSVSLQGDTPAEAGLLFSASLASGSGSGRPKVTPANDFGAWLRTLTLGNGLRKVVREGDPGFASGEKIKSFQLLQALSGSPAQGRGHYAADGVRFTATLSSKRQALVRFTSEGTLEAETFTGEQVGEALVEAQWKSFGLPASDRSGSVTAVRAVLQNGFGDVTNANATGIFLSPGEGEAYTPVIRIGDEAFGVDGGFFSGLKDPLVRGWDSGLAFLGTIKGAKGSGIQSGNDTGIWWQTPQGWSLVAREGDPAAETPEGTRWKSFTSLVLPDGETGPLFLATLQPKAGLVSGSNDTGIWAVDSHDEVRLLVREKEPVGNSNKTLKSFTALQAVSGSAGVSRSFNNAGQLVYRAYFSDGSQGVVKVQVP